MTTAARWSASPPAGRNRAGPSPMSTGSWIALFVAQMLFWLWVARYGGARWLAGRTAALVLLIHPHAPRWGEEGLKLFGWLSLIASAAWFVLGLVDHDVRSLFPL